VGSRVGAPTTIAAAAKAPKRRVGAPTTITAEAKAEVLKRLVGGESLTKICKDPRLPCIYSVYAHIDKDPEFAKSYARAREIQADVLAEEIIDISDDGSSDFVTRLDKDGEEQEVVDHEHIQRSRLRVDSRKWFASKMRPNRYGDKTIISGDQASPVVTTTMTQEEFLEIAKKIKDQI
jgi:hypothetical protein